MLITRLYTVALKSYPDYPLGGIKAKTLQEAKDLFLKITVEVFTPTLTFKNDDREYYTLKTRGVSFSKDLVLTGDFYETKQGARRLLSQAVVLSDNGILLFVANPMSNNSPTNGVAWFTTGRMREGNYFEVISTDKKRRGWISGSGASFGKEWYGFRTESTKPYVKPTTTTQTNTQVVAPVVVKPTQVIVPVAVKPTVKPLINQGYDNTFFVLEPPKEEKSNLLPILGLLLSAFTLFK